MSGVLSAGQPLSEALDGGCRVVSSDRNGLDTFQLQVGLGKTGVAASVEKQAGLNIAFNANSAGVIPDVKMPAFVPTPAPSYQSQPSYGQA